MIKLFYYDDWITIGMKDDSIILKAFFLQHMLKHYANHLVKTPDHLLENTFFLIEILSKNSQPIEPVKPSPAFEHTSTEKIDTLPDLSLSIRK